MTAPDHRPYLLPTDLRTAEDVARWLREQIDEWDADCDTANPRQVVACVAIALERRLDRERRQACRRAARYEITMARAFWRAGGGVQHLLAIAHTERALAFRAAARAR